MLLVWKRIHRISKRISLIFAIPVPNLRPIYCSHLSVLLFSRGVDSIDDLMADIAEQHEMAQEISDTISRPIGPGIDFDEVKKKMEQTGTDTIFVIYCTLFLVLELIVFPFCLTTFQ